MLSPTILRDTHLSAEAYADALAAFSVFYMIGNPLWGSLLDFIGLRKGMFAAVSLRADGQHRARMDVGILGIRDRSLRPGVRRRFGISLRAKGGRGIAPAKSSIPRHRHWL